MAWASSRDWKVIPVSFVTPSTIAAISSPKRSRTSSIEAEVSSTVSCSSAAHSVSVSRRMLAQMRATPIGCTMKSSPDLRRWAPWCSQANTKASCTRARSIATAESAACSETIANRSLSRRRWETLSVCRSVAAAGDRGSSVAAAGAGSSVVAAGCGSSVTLMIKG